MQKALPSRKTLVPSPGLPFGSGGQLNPGRNPSQRAAPAAPPRFGADGTGTAPPYFAPDNRDISSAMAFQGPSLCENVRRE
jgi:hypothetical protein